MVLYTSCLHNYCIHIVELIVYVLLLLLCVCAYTVQHCTGTLSSLLVVGVFCCSVCVCPGVCVCVYILLLD
jgi:hypothetical protein